MNRISWNRLTLTYSADASVTGDNQYIAISNLLTGFELFAFKGNSELEPLFSFKQDVSAGRPLPVRFIHGGHALMGGTSTAQVNIWDVYSRRRQPLPICSQFIPILDYAIY